MAVAFEPGQDIVRGDLDIFLTNPSSNPTNAAEISYAIFFLDLTGGPPGVEVLIGDPARVPINPVVGEYFASLAIPPGASTGTYHIRWTIREQVGSPQQQIVMEFAVVDPGTQTTTNTFTSTETALISKLRILLRDSNPDRNYSFRPPEHEQDIGQFNRIFGFVWEDLELQTYLLCALDAINSVPPETGYCNLDQLIQAKPAWRIYLMWAAIGHAAMALAFNWVADEFDYSIGGISLTIDKSSKYMQLKENAEGQFAVFIGSGPGDGIKARATKIFGGLQQPRFGRGVRSAFGPNVASGVLSPRAFI